MLYPLQHISEWDMIQKRKQSTIDKANSRENSTRLDWDYKIGEKILLFDNSIQRKLDSPTQGPFEITIVHSNGNLTIKRDPLQTESISDTANHTWNR